MDRPPNLQIRFHPENAGFFKIHQPLIQRRHSLILMDVLMCILQTFDNAPGAALDHHTGDLGVHISAGKLCLCHKLGHGSYGRIELSHPPAPLLGNGMRLCFNGIEFPPLCCQFFLQIGGYRRVY